MADEAPIGVRIGREEQQKIAKVTLQAADVVAELLARLALLIGENIVTVLVVDALMNMEGLPAALSWTFDRKMARRSCAAATWRMVRLK